MFVRTSGLRYWKREHSEASCQDALAQDAGRGLFAVADGVTTAPFSDRWSRILVEQFIRLPLLGSDPFEATWWIEQAQSTFTKELPDLRQAPDPRIHNLVRLGSASTLLTARVVEIGEDRAAIEILALGDSCAFIWRGGDGVVRSFPIEDPAGFKRSLIPVPSKNLDRRVHRLKGLPISVGTGDLLVLATDAVAKWIAGCGKGTRPSSRDALVEVAGCSPDEWPGFVDGARQRNELEDDDSTALVIRFLAEPAPDAVLLGSTTALDPQVRAERQSLAERARQEGEKPRLAVLIGDPTVSGIVVDSQDLERIRAVADAYQALWLGVSAQLAAATPNLPRLDALWREYRDTLRGEPCAYRLRAGLASLGVAEAAVGPDEAGRPAPSEEPTVDRSSPPREPSVPAPVVPEAPASPVAAAADAAEVAYSAFRAALQTGDEGAIADSYDPLLDDAGLLTPPEADRLERARKCLQMLEQVRAGLRADDDGAIAAAYDPALEGRFDTFTPEERSRILLALRRDWAGRLLTGALENTTAEQLVGLVEQLAGMGLDVQTLPLATQARERLDLACRQHAAVSRFREVLQGNDDAQIVAAYDPLLDECDLVHAERARLQLARSRLAALEQFQRAIDAGDDHAIVAAAAPGTERLIGSRGDWQQRLMLARLRLALATDDDVAIVACGVSDAILEQLGEAQQERVADAHRRQSSLWYLRLALRAGDGPEIAYWAEPFQAGEPGPSDEEWEIVAEAMRAYRPRRWGPLRRFFTG